MKCESTPTPPEHVDIAALRERYRRERDKRMRREGQEQYIRPTGDFAEIYEGDPYTPTAERDPISEDLDVAILGAGWLGILAGWHLRNAGVTDIRNIDHAGDFGGVWY